MFSGGEEGVLVQWNLNKGTKAFIPRLGATLQVSHQEGTLFIDVLGLLLVRQRAEICVVVWLSCGVLPDNPVITSSRH